MKQLSSRVFAKLSIEWKTDDASSQEVRILHSGVGAGRGEEKLVGLPARWSLPVNRPAFLPNGGENNASHKWRGRCGFIGNGLRCAILLVGLGLPTPSRAALVAAWGDNTYGQTRLPVGVNNLKAIAEGEYHNLALRSNRSGVRLKPH